jgi:hypothetical protein
MKLSPSILKFFILHFSFFIFLAGCGKKDAAPAVDPGPPPTVSGFVLKNLASEFPGEIRTTNYAGQVQLVLFLRSDDAACRGALPAWTGLQDEFAPRGFTLVGAIVDDRKPDVLAAEVAALNIPWPVGLADAPIVEAFGGPAALRAIPTAFLLGRDGLVARTYAGHELVETLRTDIHLLLDGQPLPPKPPRKL